VEGRLRARAREVIADGTAIRFPLDAVGGTVTVRRIDETGEMAVRMEGGGEASVGWGRMTDRDCLALARTLAESPGTQADHALAAFFLLASGDAERAEAHLARSGPHAEPVRAAYATEVK
jgi:hypothetical protein